MPHCRVSCRIAGRDEYISAIECRNSGNGRHFMIIAVASGKGGTGKTTVSVNLASTIGVRVQLLDCDVEEPNAHLFLRGNMVIEEIVNIPVPQVDETLCDGCGECSKFCEYHAIVILGKTPLIFPEMCHGCGGCAMVCRPKAITEAGR